MLVLASERAFLCVQMFNKVFSYFLYLDRGYKYIDGT